MASIVKTADNEPRAAAFSKSVSSGTTLSALESEEWKDDMEGLMLRGGQLGENMDDVEPDWLLRIFSVSAPLFLYARLFLCFHICT